jgi:heme-degrading monooxygenase HmoA
MISRHWNGVTRPGRADAYVDHLRRETFPGLAKIPGFVQASVLRREVDSGTEFQVVTVWESLEAIQAFAGEDLEVAVVPDAVQELMVSYDRRVTHYEIADTFVNAGSRR